MLTVSEEEEESSICGRIIIPHRNAALPLENGLSGVTKLDRIRNERIRGTTKVGEISKKVQESRLKWYGHVLRREDEYVGKRVMGMEVPGKRKEEDQSRGGWIASGTTCRRGGCQRRTRKTGLDGGVSQDTSTPHTTGKRWRRLCYIPQAFKLACVARHKAKPAGSGTAP